MHGRPVVDAESPLLGGRDPGHTHVPVELRLPRRGIAREIPEDAGMNGLVRRGERPPVRFVRVGAGAPISRDRPGA